MCACLHSLSPNSSPKTRKEMRYIRAVWGSAFTALREADGALTVQKIALITQKTVQVGRKLVINLTK
jgi:hypothetical protein